MNITLKSALGALAFAAASWAAAAPLNFAGALSAGDPTYNRVLTGTPPTTLSAVGTAVSYDSYQFYVDAAGSYRMETLTAAFATGSATDTFLTLYLGSSFNAGTPLVNALAADDDGAATGFLSLINLNLMANTNYLLVVTSFQNGQFGNYTGIVASNAGNGGNVFGGVVPTGGVPAPATAALVPLALAALALTRRRHPAAPAA